MTSSEGGTIAWRMRWFVGIVSKKAKKLEGIFLVFKPFWWVIWRESGNVVARGLRFIQDTRVVVCF